jgi:flavodoxin
MVTSDAVESGGAARRGGEVSSPKQTLVVYYSMTGNTARLARDLAARLNADVESIEDRTHGVGFVGYLVAAYHAWRRVSAPIGAMQRDPSDYAVVVIGTPVWVGQMTPAVRAYLQRMKGRFVNVAFFVTSGGTDIEKIIPSLEAEGKCKAVTSKGFNARELGDTVVYEHKLSTFIEAIKGAAGRPADRRDEDGRSVARRSDTREPMIRRL